ncbi:hypothetical protein AK830_g873 [Neonectria ditissima]|uniref:Autophagy-related protein 27 n=1 Tax=Neonectria ditissima TaxID=78410 RepID=A0A0N8H8V8_9HYPO|nr:hypothetical protein AK830_g873 [Neonectria ditissima]
MHSSQLSALLLPALAAPVLGLASLRCDNIRVDGHSFDLSQLKGPHSVVTTRYESSPPSHFNTTYTLDVCAPLELGKAKKGERCPNGTRVCAITRFLKDEDEMDTIADINPIAGALENYGGTRFDYSLTRLKTSDSTSDSQKEGLRLVLKGGKHHPIGGSAKDDRPQKAIIEFICDRNKTGTEGEWTSEDKYTKLRVRDEEKNEDGDKKEDGDKGSDDGKEEDGDKDKDGEDLSEEHQLKYENSSLIWDGFPSEKDADVLRLTWYTKYACEKREEGDDDGDDSTHWGFFTWFVIVAFLGIAAYLVFSSWLNYNRYGARGWDLLPHSDSIRDVPYLMKDWVRRVLNTVQGTGNRGGYSAV